MNKRIIGLLLAGLICVGGEVTESYANENLNEEVKVKTEQVRTQNGWVKDENGYWNYYKNGEMLKNQWIKDNGKWYYFDDYGYMAYAGSYFIDGKHYVFDNSGAMVEKKGWIYLKYEEYDYGVWYYGNGDGTVKTEQWIKDNGKWYYVDYYGDLIIDGSFEIGNKAYLFDSNGAMIEKKGWIYSKDEFGYGAWYWGNGDGTVKTNQWIKDNGKWYYVDYYGDLLTDGSFEIGNKMYLFDSNGAMVEKKVGFI